MPDRIAYHEAGHALMAYLLGGQVRRLTIDPDWDDGPERSGDVEVAWPAHRLTPRQLCESSVLVALAGPVAEMIYRQEPLHPGLVGPWAGDWQTAWQEAATLHRNQRRRLAFLEQAARDLYQRLQRDDHWAALAALADELLAHETLDSEQIATALAVWLP